MPSSAPPPISDPREVPPSSLPPPPSSKLALRELEKGTSLWRDAFRRLSKNRAALVAGAILVVMVALCIVVPEVSRFRYDQADLKLGPQPPSALHWMGTDYFGRDMMARVFFGGRISFAVGLVTTLVSFAIGVTWGGVA